MTVDKPAIAQVLRNISLLLQLKGENAFKSRAYDLGADRVLGTSEEVLAKLSAEGRLIELPGIGAALAEKIHELITTGKLAYYEGLLAQYPIGLLEVMKVPDVGPKRAAALFAQLQVKDLASLEKACLEGRVRGLKGFGEKSEQKIIAGLQLAKASTGRRRLGDVLPMAEQLLAWLKEVPGVVRASVGGSARRRSETVGDLDLIASAEDPAKVMDAFEKHPLAVSVIGRGESKCSVRMADGLQVDLRVLPDEDYATALHHFTGSKAHHIRLRGRAQELGLKISEWGVHRGEEKLRVPDEESIYRLLGMQFVPPELREDWGELEAALANGLPNDLLTEGDVLGMVHAHSTWSDGRNSLEEMAFAAQAMGLGYLTVTEHSQAASYAGGLTADALERQWEEIDRLNEKLTTLRLLKGIEVDILETGELDFPPSVLERLEVVIGSIHVRHQLDEAQMTARICRAFESPFMHILGHPSGRLIHKREPYAFRVEEVLDKAAEHGVAIEVNGNPERLDLNAEQVRLAIQRGVKLVVSSDAHSIDELKNVRYSVATARKGWARKNDVLNTLPAKAFAEALREMRRT